MSAIQQFLRLLFLLISTFFYGLGFGQHFSYPVINKTGQTLADFVPKGWRMLDSAKGDLNKDDHEDAALIIQLKDSVSLTNSEGDTVLTQPRILLILFRNASDNGYSVIEQSNTFILRHEQENMDDPYQKMKIDKGALKLDFMLFYSMGSWFITSSSYLFRYNGSAFILIGAELHIIHRATLEFDEYSYNFLTRKRIYTKGDDKKGTKKTSTSSFILQTPKTLKTFAQPFTWEFEKDIIL